MCTRVKKKSKYDFYGLAQDCGNSNALALELPQFCTEPSIKYS